MKVLNPILAIVALAAIGAAKSPPAIHLDQVGFLPDGPKHAIVADDASKPLPWQLVDATGKIVAEGRTTVFGNDAASGDYVHDVDFGAVRSSGTYRLQVDGATSQPIVVAADVFRPLSLAALNYFYQTRSGIAIEASFAGGKQWARAVGHPHEVVTCFKGVDNRGTTWPGCPYSLDVTGGWYDAGDQGKYVVNGGISVWTLQNLYETMRDTPPFADGSAKLPEAGNGRNDLLDEARWEMIFLLEMQVPDGQRLALPTAPQPASGPQILREVDAGGMAHHKIADRNWTGIPTNPADDREDRLLAPPSSAATLNLAATAAQCARIWQPIDPAFARRCLVAAGKAYGAALRNPPILAGQETGGGGGYNDRDISDELYWATAELYAATRLPELLTELHSLPQHDAAITEAPGWATTAALGTITLATAPMIPAAERDTARAKIVAVADRFLAEQKNSGYRLPYSSTNYSWGSNGTILNRAMILALAARFTGEERYRDAAIDSTDYILGRNPLDQSYVSGFGWNPMKRPHHRFWAHQFDARYPGPPPGVLSGGPNSGTPADDVARTLGKCAPQRCWRDDARGYSLNEVAINWNAPLLWVATYLDTPGKR